MANKKIAIIMGSTSDMEFAKAAADKLKEMEIPFEMKVMSAHRTPDEVSAFTRSARDNGFGAIIAIAGHAAHLAGAIAANTTLPVLGVPVASSALNGLDALLSTVMMPSGIPVATLAVGSSGAKNAAIFAAQVLALGDEKIAATLEKSRKEMAEKVKKANEELES